MKADSHIHHVNVLVDELAKAVRFYRDVLLLQPVDPPDQGFPSQFFRINDEQQIHMNEIQDHRPYRAHFCVVVPDFMAVFHLAKAAAAIDVQAWGRIRRLANGKLQMFVRDPSGNLIEVASTPGAPLDPAAVDASLFDPQVGDFTIAHGTTLDRHEPSDR